MARKTQIQVRRDTAANWTAANPTLASAEFGFETDTGKFKIGNGSSAWSALSYFTTGAGSGTVTSVSSTTAGITVATPTTTPALTLATLDAIATAGPPAADWSNNSHKITSVADPTLAQDAMTKHYADAHYGAGTISSITSSGGTITVGSPSGPTTNVDLPNSGVTGGSYGDATHVGQFTVSADGIVTAAASIGISGIAGAGFTTVFDSTLGGSATNIDTGANAIAATYQHLLVIIICRTDEAVVNSAVLMTLNGDSAGNYDRQTMRGIGSGASAAATAAQSNIPLNVPGSSVATSHFAGGFFFLPAYRQTTAHKIAVYGGGYADTTTTNSNTSFNIGNWRNTAAVNQITITAQSAKNLIAGSRMTIFGLG